MLSLETSKPVGAVAVMPVVRPEPEMATLVGLEAVPTAPIMAVGKVAGAVMAGIPPEMVRIN